MIEWNANGDVAIVGQLVALASKVSNRRRRIATYRTKMPLAQVYFRGAL